MLISPSIDSPHSFLLHAKKLFLLAVLSSACNFTTSKPRVFLIFLKFLYIFFLFLVPFQIISHYPNFKSSQYLKRRSTDDTLSFHRRDYGINCFETFSSFTEFFVFAGNCCCFHSQWFAEMSY